MTYYEILGVAEDADEDQIRKAWKATALRLHPDHGGDEVEFARARQAYETLNSPIVRRVYDRARARAAAASEPVSAAGAAHRPPRVNRDHQRQVLEGAWNRIVDVVFDELDYVAKEFLTLPPARDRAPPRPRPRSREKGTGRR